MLGLRSLARRSALALARPGARPPARGFANVWTNEAVHDHARMLELEGDCAVKPLGTTRLITLNRPKQLNSLRLNMVRWLHPRLRLYEEDEAVNAVVVTGAGEKAFCAGGDIVALYEAGKQKGPTGAPLSRLPSDFFREEYRLNYFISTLTKPYVAWLNGITMGGGVGLSVHGRFRVATEQTLFAMPETAIGFFPDVGGSHFLSRLPHSLGTYLALTGARLKGADVLHAGIATHFSTSGQLPNFLNLVGDFHERHAAVQTALDLVTTPLEELPAFSLAPHLETIARCFSRPTVEQIVEALSADVAAGRDADFASKTLATLSHMSPTSLKVTLQQLRTGATLDLDECLRMEFRIAHRMMRSPDFFEGVFKMLVNKDRSQRPAWAPSALRDVSDRAVDQYFERPVDDDDLRFDDVAPARGSAWRELEKTPFPTAFPAAAAATEYPYPLWTPPPSTPQLLKPGRNELLEKDYEARFWQYLLRPKTKQFIHSDTVVENDRREMHALFAEIQQQQQRTTASTVDALDRALRDRTAAETATFATMENLVRAAANKQLGAGKGGKAEAEVGEVPAAVIREAALAASASSKGVVAPATLAAAFRADAAATPASPAELATKYHVSSVFPELTPEILEKFAAGARAQGSKPDAEGAVKSPVASAAEAVQDPAADPYSAMVSTWLQEVDRMSLRELQEELRRTGGDEPILALRAELERSGKLTRGQLAKLDSAMRDDSAIGAHGAPTDWAAQARRAQAERARLSGTGAAQDAVDRWTDEDDKAFFPDLPATEDRWVPKDKEELRVDAFHSFLGVFGRETVYEDRDSFLEPPFAPQNEAPENNMAAAIPDSWCQHTQAFSRPAIPPSMAAKTSKTAAPASSSSSSA